MSCRLYSQPVKWKDTGSPCCRRCRWGVKVKEWEEERENWVLYIYIHYANKVKTVFLSSMLWRTSPVRGCWPPVGAVDWPTWTPVSRRRRTGLSYWCERCRGLWEAFQTDWAGSSEMTRSRAPCASKKYTQYVYTSNQSKQMPGDREDWKVSNKITLTFLPFSCAWRWCIQ